MSIIPIDLQDLNVWLAINAMILLLTSVILSPEYGKSHVRVNLKRLRVVAIIVSILFVISVVIRTLGA